MYDVITALQLWIGLVKVVQYKQKVRILSIHKEDA